MVPGHPGIALRLAEERDAGRDHRRPGRVEVLDLQPDHGAGAEERVILVVLGVDVDRRPVRDAEPGSDPDTDRERIEEPGATGRWTLPVELARKAGIEPELIWELRDSEIQLIARTTVTDIDPNEDAGAGSEVQVSFDDGEDRWTTLTAAPSGLLRTSMVTTAEPERLPAIRIRTRDLS